MKMRTCSKLCVCVLIVSLTGLADLLAAPPPEWTMIESAIGKRRAECGLVSCRLDVVRAVPRTGRYASLESEGSDDDPVVTESSHVLTIDLHNVRFRNEEVIPRFNSQRAEFSIRKSISVYNGEEGYRMYPDQGSSGPRTWDMSEMRPRELIDLANSPLLWMFGVFSPTDFEAGQVTDLAELNFRFEQSGSEITASGNHKSWDFTWVFDQDRDFNLVKTTRVPIRNGELLESKRNETQITYRNEGDAENPKWIPDSWQLSFVSYGERMTTVTEFQALASVEDSLFEVPDDYVQPGMLVVTETGPKLVAPNMSRVPYRPGQPLQPRRGWSRYLMAVGAAICLTGAGYFVYRRYSEKE